MWVRQWEGGGAGSQWEGGGAGSQSGRTNTGHIYRGVGKEHAYYITLHHRATKQPTHQHRATQQQQQQNNKTTKQHPPQLVTDMVLYHKQVRWRSSHC